MPTQAEIKKALDDEIAAAAEKPGTQSVTVAALVDPTGYIQFKIREDFVNHFGITPTSTALEGATLFVPKKKAGTGGTGTKPVTPNSAGAGTVKSNNAKIIGRAIKVPTGGGYTRKIKGVQKPIKEVTIRVPSTMSLTAIILWINTSFTGTTKKPSYFITSAGSRVSINSTFTDKSKLAKKKNE
ncbi:hypothetical protein [Microcoleus sp. B4-D4]|uniref:hypothetical protein n=1 Tax=Microcoleus sp. B4-D4 TaxID=2818667 RepID=UPI002FCFA8CC